MKTLTGRSRYLGDIKSADIQKRACAERQAVNTIIQGTASEIIKFAMIRVEEKLSCLPWAPGARLLMQVHDELIFEVEKSLDLHSFVTLVNDCMCDSVTMAFRMSVPLVVNFKVGNSLGQMKNYEQYRHSTSILHGSNLGKSRSLD